MRRPFTLFALLVSNLTLAADGLSLMTGFDTSSGKYGGNTDTEISTTYVTARYDWRAWTAKLTLPWLDLKGPAVVSGGGDTMIVAPGASASSQTRVSGAGDMVGSLAWMAWQDPASELAVDVVGKIKFATADAAKGLSTGKNDEALQFNAYQSWGRNTLMATLGYKWMGKPAGSSYQDAAFASLGMAHRVSDESSVGLLWDVRKSVIAGLPSQREVTLYGARRLDTHWSVQAYVYAGAGSASPDLGGGATVAYRY